MFFIIFICTIAISPDEYDNLLQQIIEIEIGLNDYFIFDNFKSYFAIHEIVEINNEHYQFLENLLGNKFSFSPKFKFESNITIVVNWTLPDLKDGECLIYFLIFMYYCL